MGEKKFHFQKYFLILILLSSIVGFLTYFYSDSLVKKTRRSTEEDLNKKLKLINMEDFYFDLNSSLNMNDFFFPKPHMLDGELRYDAIKHKSINEELLRELWVRSENLFNVDLEKQNESLIDRILENYK
ncbi:hypothetical protein CR532_00215 [Candidatus Borreliella tachyglossi]|uniref:Uncharacterized protein n=1 Tax=Candidatus Borreliella tachyglossi TaxID=1964448 RepID=A0A2S1LVX5_9SPIR|nr:hypothetical protein [Candidatus Borreliella tachyglossi]AWG42449.1 hypothetical protein CR532_00215 [Candidatus Borreliella tachyglossi]